MRFVLDRPDEIREIAEKGRESVQQFEFHKALGHYANTYLDVVS